MKSKPDISVIKPGTPVTLNGDIEAVVVELSIASNLHVQYRCAWWSGSDRKVEWLEEHEVSCERDTSLTIGFAQKPNDR